MGHSEGKMFAIYGVSQNKLNINKKLWDLT